ncbi:hypothetical protein OQJ67_19785, partial [Pseudoalteromonas sp. B530]|nr:hypothetical protein [Pseudoalteromonas sp. B530]
RKKLSCALATMSWNIPYPNLRLNSKIFVLLSTRFSRLKIEHLIKQIDVTPQSLAIAASKGLQ